MKEAIGVSLKPYNTFGLEAKAERMVTVESREELETLYATGDLEVRPFLVLGGGSNMLLTKDQDGLVLKIEILGHEVLSQDEETVVVRFGAGEVWHDVVMQCLDHGWFGIENLSLIPGTIGAAPIQNIGAYGVELKDVFVSLEGFELETGRWRDFSKEECDFGYRWSSFKGEFKGKFIVTSVTLKLSKNTEPQTSYGAIQQVLDEKGKTSPTPKDVSDAVIEIRQSKLPDPKEIGNSGSFFKNPVIPVEQFEQLKVKFPNIVSYPVDEEYIKVPAGWLIDQAGWKGKTFGQIGVHKNQALVLVNYGQGKGADLAQLSKDIQEDIKAKYGISLEPEVNIL